MTLDEFKQETSKATGIPINLLEGETGEEVISRAKAIYAMKQKNEVAAPKTAAEQFADWFKSYEAEKYGEEVQIDIFEGLSNTAREVDGIYTTIPDTSIDPIMDGIICETPAEQFTAWFKGHTAFDPSKENGWTNLPL